MRYQITVPKPSAKRLEKDRKLIIKLFSGWFGGRIMAEHEIPEGVETFEFDFEGPIEHRDPNILDGDYHHEFSVLYQNSTGSRKEEIGVSPSEKS